MYSFVFLALSSVNTAAREKNYPAKIYNTGRQEVKETDMKVIMSIILFLIVMSFAMMLLPLCIAVIVANFEFSSGNIIGGIIAIVIGIAIQMFWLWYMSDGEVSFSAEDEECPNCSSSATDGNHCYECGEDNTYI